MWKNRSDFPFVTVEVIPGNSASFSARDHPASLMSQKFREQNSLGCSNRAFHLLMSLYYHVLFSPHSNLSGLSLVAVITEGEKKG